MPINKNHEFEDLNGAKCAVVERNASKGRTEFLRELLEFNNFSVVIIPSPPPKSTPLPKPAQDQAAVAEVPAVPETFTIGVTNLAFNAVNAVFGRLLRTKQGHIVTLAYWEQKEPLSNDELPYFEQTS